MSEVRADYNLLQSSCETDKIEQESKPLSTHNLDELQRELGEIERKLLPLLNAIRAIRGEKPVYVPKG